MISITALACCFLGISAVDDVSFKADVAPILVGRCLGCHNDKKSEAGLNIKTYEKLRNGGRGMKSDIVVPGDPDTSYLIELLAADAAPRMPYKQPPLAEAEVATLRRWISEGAKFDGESAATTVLTSLVNPLELLPKLAPETPVSEPVRAVAFSPGGDMLAAAVGSSVELYDAGAAKLSTKLDDHPGPVYALRFSSDGHTLAACGGTPGLPGFIVVWDLPSRQRRHTLTAHADSILGADLSHDGAMLVTCSYDRMIKLWNVDEGKELRTLKEHTDAVYGVAFSPDASRIASAGGDRIVKVWDTQTGKRLVSLSDATAEQYAVAWGQDGEMVFAGGVDRTIRAWRVRGAEGTLEHSAFAHDGPILQLALDPSSQALVSSSEDRLVKLWNAATLEPRATLLTAQQWPGALAIDPGSRRLAVGQFDGRLLLASLDSGDKPTTIRTSPVPDAAHAQAEAKKPELFRYATLAPPSPRAGRRGTTVKVRLAGHGVGQSKDILFLDSSIRASLLPTEQPEAGSVAAEFDIAADAQPGLHAFLLRTPNGATPPATFLVTGEPDVTEIEPNDTTAQATPATLPAVLTGTIEQAGDVDRFTFQAEPGKTLVFDLLAGPMGSSLSGRLALFGESGRQVAEAVRRDDGRQALLTYEPPEGGKLTLEVSDMDMGGSGNHFYRVIAGVRPLVTAVFPPGRAPSDPAAPTYEGANLSEPPEAEHDAAVGTLIPVHLKNGDGGTVDTGLRRVVADGLQSIEAEPNDDPEHANAIAAPGGASGHISKSNDVDLYRFSARKGDRQIIEVYGRRLGSPVDTAVEVLDAQGQPVPRAVLRPLRQTYVAFRDHPSLGRNVRLTFPWTGFNQGDYVLLGREVSRISELPRNLDDDSVLWGLGNPRNNTGERIALLGTTPEHHPQSQPIYQVEIHPPGTTFPAGGVPPFTIYHRNDDGGPGFGKDSYLEFDPPADGEYLLRVEDVRGLAGNDFTYHVILRRPRPDFQLSLNTDNPNIPRGSSIIVPVNLTRVDGFMGSVEVRFDNLPPGIRGTSALIEPEQYTADLLLSADADAPQFPTGNWTVTGRAIGSVLTHTLDPGGASGGWITVTPGPNIRVSFDPERVEIVPGQEATMRLRIERRNGFNGRVPIEVHNLPFGVRVLNIGLNGVLVTEDQTERVVTLFAEPWAMPQERPFYAVAQCEAAGTNDSSSAITLAVQPARQAPATVQSR